MTSVTVTLSNGTSIVWEVTEAEAKRLEGQVQEVSGPIVKIEVLGEAL